MKSFKQFISEAKKRQRISTPAHLGRGAKEMAKAGLARIGMSDTEKSSKGQKPGQGVSRLTTQNWPSGMYTIWRIFGEKVFGDEEEEARVPGLFKSKRAANKKAREIAAKTGEPVR